MICGLLRPDAGSVELDGVAIGAGASSVKHKTGLVPQDLALYDDLSLLFDPSQPAVLSMVKGIGAGCEDQ